MTSGLTVTQKVDVRKLQELRKNAPQRAAANLSDAADEIVDDIKAHWSTSSPSSAGNPPAYVSGKLDASIKPGEQTQSGGHLTRRIEVRAAHGDFLEYGTRNMAARPFIRPAMMRARKRWRRYWVNMFKT